MVNILSAQISVQEAQNFHFFFFLNYTEVSQVFHICFLVGTNAHLQPLRIPSQDHGYAIKVNCPGTDLPSGCSLFQAPSAIPAPKEVCRSPRDKGGSDAFCQISL